MRIITRYKIYSKNYNPIFSLPKNKLLKFHRPKWQKVQKLLLKKKSKNWKRFFFKNHSLPTCSMRRWFRYRFVFQTRLNLKKSIQLLSYNVLTNKAIKKLFLKSKISSYFSLVQTALFKIEYRIDMLLWRLAFFNTWYLSQRHIKKDGVILNKKKIYSLFYLTVGDILEIPFLNVFKFSSSIDNINPFIFNSFIELDYYTNTLIVIKNLRSLNKKDFFLLTKFLYNVYDLKDYTRI